MAQSGEFQHLNYLRTYANPIMNNMCLALLDTKPEEPEQIIDFMIEWLNNEKTKLNRSPSTKVPAQEKEDILETDYGFQFPAEREGESRVMRNALCRDKLIATPQEGMNTLQDMYYYIRDHHPNEDFIGQRVVKEDGSLG